VAPFIPLGKTELYVIDSELRVAFSIVGAINNTISPDFSGRIKVYGEYLIYKDYSNNIRVIEGTNTGEANYTQNAGDIYVIDGELRWVSDTTPRYVIAIKI
jgi:hypothetical protein